MNKMTITKTMLAAAAFALAACTGDEQLDNPDAQVELRLTSALEVQTRAAHGLDTQLKDGEAVRVWVDNAVTGEELYLNNTLTAGSSGALTGGETMCFPVSCNAVDIYAIHGNFAEGTDYTNFWGTAQTHTVAQDQRSTGSGYARSDLVYAKRTNVAPDGNPTTVCLTFTHLLSKVEVVLVQGLGAPDIAKVEILNTLLDATFTPSKTDQTITVAASGAVGENPIEIDTELTDINEATIVPQTLAAGTEFVRITTTDGTELFYTLPEDKTFAPGEKYRFTITASTEPLGDTELADAAVGDYYMKDGTVLGGENTLTPTLASKVIGIVFCAGHHNSDNSDYTNTGIGQAKCHGYAVALTDVHNDGNDRLRWEYGPNRENNQMVNASTNSSDWNGYSNQQKFHEFVNDETNNAAGWEMKHFPAALACETYGNRTVDQNGNPTTAYDWQQPLAAPHSSSGWFLPSCGQLFSLYSDRELFSIRMTYVKNNIPTDCSYKDYIKWFSLGNWSSTENSQYDAWLVDFNYGYADDGLKGYTYDVRAVLAF